MVIDLECYKQLLSLAQLVLVPVLFCFVLFCHVRKHHRLLNKQSTKWLCVSGSARRRFNLSKHAYSRLMIAFLSLRIARHISPC